MTALSILNVSLEVLILGAITANLAHYLSLYLDITFLDIDLVAPWSLVVLLMLQKQGTINLKNASLAFGIGLYVASGGFVESQASYAICVALISLIAFFWLGWRALILGLLTGVSFTLSLPRLLEFAHFLPLLSGIRSTLTCVASQGIGWKQAALDSLMIFWRRGPSLSLILPIGAIFTVLWQALRSSTHSKRK